MRKRALTLNVFLLIVMTDILESVAEILMKKGLTLGGISYITFSNFFEFVAKNAFSSFIWTGILLYCLGFFIWIAVLSRVELSVAFPAGSTSYIFVPLLSMIFLRESIAPLQWLGIVSIAVGVHFISNSKPTKQFEKT